MALSGSPAYMRESNIATSHYDQAMQQQRNPPTSLISQPSSEKLVTPIVNRPPLYCAMSRSLVGKASLHSLSKNQAAPNEICHRKRPRSKCEEDADCTTCPPKLRIRDNSPSDETHSSTNHVVTTSTALSRVQPLDDITHQSQELNFDENQLNTVQADVSTTSDSCAVGQSGLETVTYVSNLFSPGHKLQAIPMSLGELRRRTEYPEFFGRSELVSYLRHSKTTGNDLIAKYEVKPASANPRLNVLSRLCEREAKTLAGGIHKINNEYFPISYVTDTMKEHLQGETSLEAPQRLDNEDHNEDETKEVVTNTIQLLENLKHLLTQPEGELANDLDIFERATHTFGCQNMINHISFIENCLEELKTKL